MPRLGGRLRQWAEPLRTTPLHPQWLLLRYGQRQRDMLAEHVTGSVLDVGCGPAGRQRVLPLATRYMALDYYSTAVDWYGNRPDVFADAQRLPLADDCVDTVLLLDVIEHLPDPAMALAEAGRVVKPGGNIIVTVPFMYPVHDAPLDFHRWTRFGLARVAEQAQLHAVSVSSVGRPVETGALLVNLALATALVGWLQDRRPMLALAPVVVAMVPLVNLFGAALGRLLPEHDFMSMGLSARLVPKIPASS